MIHFIIFVIIGVGCQKAYFEKWDEYLSKLDYTKKLESNLIKRQERYIAREQEYRKTIEELKSQITGESMNPFRIEGKGGNLDDENSDGKPLVYAPTQKTQEIVHDYKEIIDMINMIQTDTARLLLNQKKDMCKILNGKYNNFQKKIEEEKDKTGENIADFKQRQKELKENLETMTQIAQRIDNENINLIKKNAELSIEFKLQAKDKDLLIKQIIQQKKLNQENSAKLTNIRQVAEELEKKMQEEQKADEEVNKANNDYSKRKSSATSVKRKNTKSGAGSRKKGKKNKRIIMSHSKKSLRGGDLQGDIINMRTGSAFYRPGYNRAYSANVYGNPKLRRYEQVIQKLKKMINNERKKLRDIRTIYAKEIESKTQLESLLRQ